MGGSNAFYLLIQGRLNGLLERNFLYTFLKEDTTDVFLLRFDLFIFVNILSLVLDTMGISRSNEKEIISITVRSYFPNINAKVPQKPPPRNLRSPRMRTDIVPRVPLSIVRAYFELVGVVKQIFGMVFLFRARDSRPPSLRRKKCYYWEVSRRKRNRVRRTRLNEGTFFALPNPIKISPV